MRPGRLSLEIARQPLLAFLLAPLAAPLIYLAIAAASGGFVSFDLALFIAQSAYLVALVGGLPLHIMLGKLGWVSLHDYMVFGALLGGLAALAMEHAPIAFSALLQAGLAALYGAVAGGIFWLIARPDRRATSTG